MKFYDCKTAPSPRRVRMFIAEKGLDIDTVEVNLSEKEQLGEAFLKINPHATVPVLALDNGVRLRSTAGCRAYIESAHPSPPLLGADSSQKGQIADLIYRIEADALLAVGECLRNSSKGMKGRAVTGPHNYEQIPELAERGRQRAANFLPVLDGLIGDKPFIAGDAISAADIDAFIFLEFSRWIKLDVPDSLGNIIRWRAAMSDRPSAKL